MQYQRNLGAFNPNRHRTEKLGDVLHHCGQFRFQNYKKSSVAEMLMVLSLFPLLDARAKILSIYDCRKGVGKLVFKLAPLGHGPLFEITSRNLCEPSFSDVVFRQIICQASLWLNIDSNSTTH